MNLPNLNTGSNTTTALVLGAGLAMVSGIVANQLEAHFRRRDRERSAALLFGEVFSTLRIVLEGAAEARTIGDPYGPLTRRLLHAARREIDIYERNRESLVDLREAKLRSDLHNLALRVAMPLDGLLEAVLLDRTSELTVEARDRAFDYMMVNVARIPEVTRRLGKIAKHSFDDYGEAVRLGAPPTLP